MRMQLTGLDMATLCKSRDHGELQDMYRRTLAASWAAHADELPADQCLEDIFNGGDGWKHHDRFDTPKITQAEHAEEEDRIRNHHRSQSGASSKSVISQNTVTTGKMTPRSGHKHSNSRDTLAPSPASNNSATDLSRANSPGSSSDRGRTGYRRAPGLDEFDIRDDLVAWRLPGIVK